MFFRNRCFAALQKPCPWARSSPTPHRRTILRNMLAALRVLSIMWTMALTLPMGHARSTGVLHVLVCISNAPASALCIRRFAKRSLKSNASKKSPRACLEEKCGLLPVEPPREQAGEKVTQSKPEKRLQEASRRKRYSRRKGYKEQAGEKVTKSKPEKRSEYESFCESNCYSACESDCESNCELDCGPLGPPPTTSLSTAGWSYRYSVLLGFAKF
jgi:hypothetical protein